MLSSQKRERISFLAELKGKCFAVPKVAPWNSLLKDGDIWGLLDVLGDCQEDFERVLIS